MDCESLIPGPVSLVEPRTDNVYVDMPRADELLKSVTSFARAVMSETTGRTQFLARVAGILDSLRNVWASGCGLGANGCSHCWRARRLM